MVSVNRRNNNYWWFIRQVYIVQIHAIFNILNFHWNWQWPTPVDQLTYTVYLNWLGILLPLTDWDASAPPIPPRQDICSLQSTLWYSSWGKLVTPLPQVIIQCNTLWYIWGVILGGQIFLNVFFLDCITLPNSMIVSNKQDLTSRSHYTIFVRPDQSMLSPVGIIHVTVQLSEWQNVACCVMLGI